MIKTALKVISTNRQREVQETEWTEKSVAWGPNIPNRRNKNWALSP